MTRSHLCEAHSLCLTLCLPCEAQNLQSEPVLQMGQRRAPRRRFACPRSHSWEAVGLGSKRRLLVLWRLSSSGLPRCLLSCESRTRVLQRERPRRQTLVNQHISFFPFGIWVWFRFELRAPENETTAVITVAVGSKDNPRGFSNLGPDSTQLSQPGPDHCAQDLVLPKLIHGRRTCPQGRWARD